MKRIFLGMLLGGMFLPFPGIAATQQPEPGQSSPLFATAGKGLFHLIVGGDSISLPCAWSAFERLGWRFADPAQADAEVVPLRHTTLLADTDPVVIRMPNGEVALQFCNVDTLSRPRHECLVFGMQSNTPDDHDFYAFELPGSIRGGITTEEQVQEIYNTPIFIVGIDTSNGFKRLLTYKQEFEKPEIQVQVYTDESGDMQGIVTGFRCQTPGAVATRIAANPGLLSDYQADSLLMRQRLFREIGSLEAELTNADNLDSSHIAHIQSVLGYLYSQSGDIARGLHYYLLGAQGGNVVAQFNTAISYDGSEGIEADPVLAAKWYTAAAEQGHAPSMNNLGYAYETGEGVAQDFAQAAEWYRRAAEAGNSVAMSNYAECCAEGKGVEVDFDKVFEWAQKAAEEHYVQAYSQVGYCYHYGKGAKKDLSEARRWYQLGDDGGDQNASYNLAVLYYNAEGVKRDYDKAFECFSKADQEDFSVRLALAACYFQGHGTEKDPEKAACYYRSCLQELEAEPGKLPKEKAKIKKTLIRLLGGKLKNF